MICNDLSSYSRFYQRLERRYVDFLSFLSLGEPQRPAMQTTLDALLAHGLDTSAALRVLRQLVMHRLISLDCDHQAPLAVVTRAVTELAELTLEVALQTACQDLDARHGAPLAESSQERAQLWVIGMGKLGARELNVSSDIDLIYVYDQDGDTAGNAEGRNRISNHEYFAKAVKIIYDLIGAVTEHGFVFRVDLALRPNGNSGP
ncbi:MAG: glutamine-synthetase adenylyltransferase, partial [Burkholderiaceae bacterium]